ncbi:MAG: lipopolysaccharide core heptose(I) kinase RfaP [Pseudomonadales bacterium]
MNIFHLEPRVADTLPSEQTFDHVMRLQGEAIRAKEGRHTYRVQLGERRYFIKIHHGIGWREIIKELLSLRLPIVSAINEKKAIDFLHSHNITTVTLAGYGQRGSNPARMQSFVITDALEDSVTLKDITENWPARPPAYKEKQALLRSVAGIARTMHEAGMNHRDFYLCHFRMLTADGFFDAKAPPLYLMDLHRAQRRESVPLRWRVKDIAALYFSASDIDLTARDFYRFMRLYRGTSLRATLREDAGFWLAVRKRAERFYQRDWRRPMPAHFPLQSRAPSAP